MSRPVLEPVERAPSTPAAEPEHRIDGAGNRIDLDSQGRYVLPDPETGDAAKWIRVTRFISAIDDTEALRRWELRSLMRACAERPTALEQVRPPGRGPAWAASKHNDSLVDSLLAEARSPASVGTGLHEALEAFDQTGAEPEADSARDYALTYSGTLRRSGFCPMPDRIERVVVSTRYPVGRHRGVAGTVDRWLMATQPIETPDGGTIAPGGVVIADLKTGQRPPADKYVAAKYCRQLAAYASAAWMYDGDGTYIEAPRLATHDWGLIVHAPAGADPPECSIWWMDLAAGRADLDACQAVLERRRVTPQVHQASPDPPPKANENRTPGEL